MICVLCLLNVNSNSLFQPYPPEKDIELLSKADGSYSTAKQRVEELIAKQDAECEEGGRKRPVKVVGNRGTLMEGFMDGYTFTPQLLFKYCRIFFICDENKMP